jgi:DNA-binding LytR/AlgR family response regulator
MRVINTKLDLSTIQKDLNIIMDETSEYSLIEHGMETVPNCINIIFKEYSPKMILELLKESGYFKTSVSHLIGTSGDGIELIPLNEVIYIEGINNDTFIHTKNHEFSAKQKLYELESSLKQKMFVRVSKSYIVSISKIKKIRPTFNGKLLLLMNEGTNLEVTRHYIGDFRKILGM